VHALQMHFSTADFCMHNIVLRTVVFPESHTGENIKAAMDETVRLFGLQDKRIIYVTDQGSNVVKACKLADVERYGCVAHGLHNLIMTDGIGKCDLARTIIDKVKELIKSFTYKTSFLENEAREIANETALRQMEALCDQLDLDEQIEVEHEAGTESEGQEEPCSSKNSHRSCKQVRATTLKKIFQTRWNTIHTMLSSVVENQEIIERCLSRLRFFDKMLSDNEWQTIKNFAQFLAVFKQATAILSGCKYPTLSLVLLFTAEMRQALQISPTDCLMLQTLKRDMQEALERRLPVTELQVVAAMLDPSLRHLDAVQEFLTTRGINAVDLLSRCIDKYVGDDSSEIVQQTAKPAFSQKEMPWKKAKMELLSKHSCTLSGPSREIQQYRCLSMETDNPLEWWGTQKATYKQLSQLARAILPIPATSAPSERIFSLTGVLINAKRSSLSPSTVDKVVFVHENNGFVGGP
jgi:hypothetical protein